MKEDAKITEKTPQASDVDPGVSLRCVMGLHRWFYGSGPTRSSLQVPPVIRVCQYCKRQQKWDNPTKEWRTTNNK
jgi:hypothetical protein